MTIEEKMDHFRSLSLESASSKSAESLSSYKQSLDDDLELHKETASQLAEESKKALMNQVRANSKKKLSSEQMKIKKELLQDYLDEQEITATILARNMGINAAEVEKLLSGIAVNEETARRFIYYFGADNAAEYIDWAAIGKQNPFADKGKD